MSADDIKLPPLARPQVPLVEADVSLFDIKVLARWCERTATEYARAAVLADRASRATQAPAAAGDARDREDAERYRLLRRKVCIAGGEFHILNLYPRYTAAPDAAAELDAAIDAAIDRARGKERGND